MAVDEARLKTSVEKKENCVRVVDVEVSEDELLDQMEELFKELAPSLTVPGFRPGKAPRRLVERKFHKTVRQDAVDAVISKSFETVCEKEGLNPVSKPMVEDVESEEGGPIKYRATVEVAPVATLGKYKGLKLERPICKVTDENVEAAIDSMRHARAVVEPVEGRAVRIDDLVQTDLEVFDGETLVDDLSREGMNLRMSETPALPELQALIIGQEVSATFEGEFTIPEDSQLDLKGKTVRAVGTVKGIKERVVPELTDEFANEVDADFQTVADLKNSLRERLTEEVEDEADSRLNAVAIDAVIDDAEIEVPQSFVARLANDNARDRINRMRISGVAPEAINEHMEDIVATASADAEHSVKAQAVLAEIVKVENIEVTDDEIADEVKKIREYGENMGWDLDRIDRHYSTDDSRDEVKSRLEREKAIKFVLDNAKVKDVKAKETLDTDTAED
jgi:trigger factor